LQLKLLSPNNENDFIDVKINKIVIRRFEENYRNLELQYTDERPGYKEFERREQRLF